MADLLIMFKYVPQPRVVPRYALGRGRTGWVTTTPVSSKGWLTSGVQPRPLTIALAAAGRNAILGSRLTSAWSIEEYPHGEVRRKVLEPVRLTGGNEKEGAGFDRVALLAIEEHRASPTNKIDFVSIMRLLGITFFRSVHFHFKRAVGKDRNG